jgi:hypothetical protein
MVNMFLNIITPCSRPENLHTISQSINIPKENYRWIVIFDMDNLPAQNLIPENCETYLHRNPISITGHAQRNFAIEKIDQGFIYSNDDDTIIHPELWANIQDKTDYDFIHFQQENLDGSIRLYSNVIEVEQIDSHNFIFKVDLLEDTKWHIDRYNADGYIAKEIYARSKHPLYLNKVLSTYNSLK